MPFPAGKLENQAPCLSRLRSEDFEECSQGCGEAFLLEPSMVRGVGGFIPAQVAKALIGEDSSSSHELMVQLDS